MYQEKKERQGHLGGSVGFWVSDFSSGPDLTVREFEPHVGLCADSSEPGACFGFCVSLSFCPSPAHALSFSVSKINKIMARAVYSGFTLRQTKVLAPHG